MKDYRAHHGSCPQQIDEVHWHESEGCRLVDSDLGGSQTRQALRVLNSDLVCGRPFPSLRSAVAGGTRYTRQGWMWKWRPRQYQKWSGTGPHRKVRLAKQYQRMAPAGTLPQAKDKFGQDRHPYRHASWTRKGLQTLAAWSRRKPSMAWSARECALINSMESYLSWSTSC